MNSEYNILDDNDNDNDNNPITIVQENPFNNNSMIVNENIDYKNYTKVKIRDKITYLENKNFKNAISLQIFGKSIMELILINFIYSLLYVVINYWEISLISLISLYGIYSIRNFNKTHLRLYIIYIILSTILRFIVCVYNFLNYDLNINIISFFLFVHELIIFILLYKFYIKLP